MRVLTADINGIIRELSLNENDILIPLFECVVNAIQAIDECNDRTQGYIDINITRDETQTELFEQYSTYPLQTITVVDNGIGFTDENIESYTRAYSSKKQKLGGKGIGRFAMLSFFENIDIDSTTQISGGFRRKKLHLDRENGFTEELAETKLKERRTSVCLSSLLPKFQKASSKYQQEVMADAVLNHCLLYFINGIAPKIRIIEKDNVIDLKNQFSPKDYIIDEKNISHKGHTFKLSFIKSEKKYHSICLCANNRKVKGKKVTSILPIFSSPIKWNNVDTYFDLFVISEYLDDKVNSSRTDFRFPKEQKEDEIPDIIENEITEKELYHLILDSIQKNFASEIDERRNITKNKVNNYLATDKGLGYRCLSLQASFFDNVPDDISDTKLDELLHEEEYKQSKIVKSKLDKLSNRDYTSKDDYQKLLKEYVALSTDFGRNELAKYVAHQKTIIDLLDKYLQWCDNEKNYEQEQALHNIIYTMGGSSDTIEYDKNNLWLLDDRLVFHRYIYSDKQIRLHAPVEGIAESQKETDIAIYDTSYVYGEKDDYQTVNSVVIFELKRPNRDITYDEFSKQMLDQICGIEEGKTTDYNGKHIALRDHTPITFYYVCDVNAFEGLKNRALKDGYKLTPYNSLFRLVDNCHQEIFTYQTLLINARRRNMIFFKKLGL